MRDHEDLIDSLFPIGKERWIKIKYIDQDKSKKVFAMFNATQENIEAKGYEVTAIGVKDEYEPQLSALLDVQDAVTVFLRAHVDEHALQYVRQIFRDKCDELQRRTISRKDSPHARTEPPPTVVSGD